MTLLVLQTMILVRLKIITSFEALWGIKTKLQFNLKLTLKQLYYDVLYEKISVIYF